MKMNLVDSSAAKKISAETLKRIGSIDPDTLETHGVITKAQSSGYICPMCGSGSGSHGTGMAHNAKIESHTSFTCFSGGHSFNVLKLCAIHYNLDTKNDFQALVEKICADFDIDLNYEEFSMTSGKRTAKKPSKSRKSVSAAELKNILDDLNSSIDPLKTFMKFQPAEKWRGFDFDFLQSHGCRLINDWTPPNTRGTNRESKTKTLRMIVPADETSYLARLVNDVSSYDIKARPHIKAKLHAGRKKLFGADVLTADEPILCFEGFIDAMSAELAGFKAVALGGRSEGELLVAAVDNLKPKPQIIILFDSDSAGRQSAPQLRADLLAIKCPCVVRFLDKPPDEIIDNDSDCDSGAAVMSTHKIDANDILQKYGVNVLRVMLQEIIDGSLSELNAVETELAKKDSAGLSDDDWDFIFSGDATDLDFARSLERFCGSVVRWLTDDERWAIYKSGVWRLGSEKSSCVAPFARQLADVMLQNADDKDERNLAHALKSSKKIGSAVTMLKTLDSIMISAADLDKHSNLLNCKNSVIDLETGKLLDADPSLYLTQQANIDFDARADSAFVEKFFEEIQPDEMTRRGLLRWLGYCLTGSVREEKFLVWLGESGANGKGVLSRTLSALLRDYAAALPRTALVLRKFDDGNAHTAALNALTNARFAISEELPQNVTLDSALLKTLTGGDIQPFRRLREEFKDVEPTFKINMSSNFIPKFENVDDGGIKRRLLVMPFNVTFTDDKADPHLKEKMLAPDNLRGLLRILVDEAKAWYRDGLIISAQMLETTRENLDANNFISDFLEEFCDVGFGKGEVPRRLLLAKLREKYPQAHRFNDRDLCKMIERRGIEYMRGMHGFIFRGIRLLTDDDFAGEPIDDRDIPSFAS